MEHPAHFPSAHDEAPLVVSATTLRPEVARRTAWTLTVVALLLLWVPHVGLFFGGYVLCVAFCFARLTASARRLSGLGVVLDAEGIAPTEHGERLWTLPWAEYGGYRVVGDFRRPERTGYAILDRAGEVAFVAPVLNRRGGPVDLALREELDTRVPEGGFAPPDPSYRPPRLRNVAFSVLVAGAAIGVAVWASTLSPLDPRWLLTIFGALVAVGSSITAGMEVVHLARRARGWRPKAQRPLPRPEEGPRLRRHVATQGRHPLMLEEGRRYRWVDPKTCRLRAKNAASVLRVMACLYGGFAVLVLALAFQDPKAGWFGILFGLLMLAFAVVMAVGARVSRQSLTSIGDAYWVHEGHLVIVRREGEPLILPLPHDEARSRRLKTWWGVTDAWTLPSGERYLLDRTRLYAAPVEIEE